METTRTPEQVQEQIKKYVETVTEAQKQRYERDLSGLIPPTYTAEKGSKNTKIVEERGNGGGRSVHCFIDNKTGDLLKAAGWKAPAKGVRGNIFNEKFPIFCGDFYIRG